MIIYKAENKINGKCYIGKTAYTLKARKACHLSYARKNKNTYFHKAIRKYGEENFEWIILAEADSELKLNTMEKFYIMMYRKMIGVYNLTDGGDGQTGCSPTEETKEKLSKMFKGKSISEETKNKISNSNRGKIRTAEFKKNLSESRKGLKHSNETLLKMSNAQKGRKHSEESKKKMSFSAKGNTFWQGKHHTEETKLKMSLSAKGKIISEETKLKLSLSAKGKIISEETKKKMSAAQMGNKNACKVNGYASA